MKKKIWMILIVVVLLVFAAVIVFAKCSMPQDEVQNILNRADEILGDEWKKQEVTKGSDKVYFDGEGNTIIQHVCVTTYYEAKPDEQSGLNMSAISSVIAPDVVESCRECMVCNLLAVLYQKDGRAYLCWTIMPELSCVIEYDPAVVCEEDIFRMAESIPANDVQSTEP